MTPPPHIHLPEVDSTNTWVRTHASTLAHGTLVTATAQTAGRGQRGNSWESAPGLNLTCTLLLRPEGIRPARQFTISEAVALAVVALLRRHLAPEVAPGRVKVKWPNDVYVDDRKIAGILIEHSIESADRIGHTIAGIGLNVNQRQFLSDAPNPVAMASLTGYDYDLPSLATDLQAEILAHLAADPALLHTQYMHTLWRGDGALHPFRVPDGRLLQGRIHSVAPDGILTIAVAPHDALHSFAFKEIAFVLD